MKTSISVAVLVFLSIQTQARLGETPAQIEARYGKPTDTPFIIGHNEYSLDYAHDDYSISVRFWNGKSAKECVSSSDKAMDDDTAKTLFKTISGKDKFTVKPPAPITDKKLAYITYYNADGAQGDFVDDYGERVFGVTVSSTEYVKHVLDGMDKNKKESLQNF